ncbi:MAG: hypothetical protein AAF311_11680 [Pseudomonadota bacterium]
MGVLRYIAVALASLALGQDAWASAWNPEPGHGEMVAGYVFIEADEAIGDRGETIRLDTYTKRMTQNYATVGLTPRLAVIGTFDWQEGQIVQPGLDLTFSDPSSITAGLQYQISRREGHAAAIAVSYVAGIDLPNALITVENRRASLEARGMWGESQTWRGRNLFAEAQLAGRVRLSGGYDSAHAQLTIGLDQTERLTLFGKGRFADIAPGEFRRIPVARQTRWEAETGAVYRFRKNDFIELSLTSVLGGRSTVLERELKIGYWRKF